MLELYYQCTDQYADNLWSTAICCNCLEMGRGSSSRLLYVCQWPLSPWIVRAMSCYIYTNKDADLGTLLAPDPAWSAAYALVSPCTCVWTWYSSDTVVIAWAAALWCSCECWSPKLLVCEIKSDRSLMLGGMALLQSEGVACVLAKLLCMLIHRYSLMNVLTLECQ